MLAEARAEQEAQKEEDRLKLLDLYIDGPNDEILSWRVSELKERTHWISQYQTSLSRESNHHKTKLPTTSNTLQNKLNWHHSYQLKVVSSITSLSVHCKHSTPR